MAHHRGKSGQPLFSPGQVQSYPTYGSAWRNHYYMHPGHGPYGTYQPSAPYTRFFPYQHPAYNQPCSSCPYRQHKEPQPLYVNQKQAQPWQQLAKEHQNQAPKYPAYQKKHK